MKFRELFQDIEDWFWKLEFNPETMGYELYLGIPNDWVYSENDEDIKIELIHQLEKNSIIKIYYDNSDDESTDYTVDDVLDIAKFLILKNQELEKRKQEHKEEMENLKNILIAKEKNFLEYIDKVKDNTVQSVTDAVDEGINKVKHNTAQNIVTINDIISKGVNDAVIEGINNAEEFLNHVEKLKLK